MASGDSRKMEEGNKCVDCGHAVVARDKGIECEVCDRWFHIKCQDIGDDTYKFLKKNPGAHWYCKVCDLGVGKILKTVVAMQQRQDKMEERQHKIEEIQSKMEKDISLVKGHVQELKETMEKKLKNCIETELQKRREEMKILIDEGLIKMHESMKTLNTQDVCWKDVVAKEVDDKLLVMSADLSMVQKSVEETKEKIAEEADKQNRRNNVIFYNVPESQAVVIADRIKADKEYCLGLMNEVLKVGGDEGSIKKVLRLGKRIETAKARPLLVEFGDGHTKNLVMEYASRLSQAKGQFEHVTISHDMTVKEREQCRKLVAEAKKQQADDQSGEYIYRVRGPPGQMKIVKYKKTY